MSSPPPRETPLGATRFNSDVQKLEYFNGDAWLQINTQPIAPIAGRGLMFSGYYSPASTNIIEYVNIQSQGNAIDFGDTDRNADHGSGYGNETRAVYAGGQGAPSNTISYVTIATTGNATNFGDLNGGNNAFGLGFSGDHIRGVYAGGGIPGSSGTDTIQYINIGTTGNMTDFGNLTQGRQSGGSVNSPTRGIYGGGNTPTGFNIMDYINIQSTGNAVDFGDLKYATRIANTCSNATRGIFAGQYDPYPSPNVTGYMQYITISTKGNSGDFGDAMFPCYDGQGMNCDSTRGLIVHGYSGSPMGYNNVISYITIPTKGDSTDFGDRSANTAGTARGCNSHGGLG